MLLLLSSQQKMVVIFLKAINLKRREDSGRRVERKIVYIMKADDRGAYCRKHRLIEEKKRK